MHKLRKEETAPYPASQLYKIVLDIESYPLFLPWCEAARIISQNEHEIIAELVIVFKGVSESYKSAVTFSKIETTYQIEALAISGPFKHLKNTWKFTETDQNSCNLEFALEFKLKSFILDKLIGTVFSHAVSQMVEAFEKRASTLKNNNLIT